MLRRYLIVLAVLLLTACDSRTSNPPPDIMKTQRETMNKAKDVGQVLQQSADQEGKQVDQQK
jgi:outer membrane biogenesis lipoprotein LolB